ncbi:hypothetical protein HKD37_04G010476 [Glycine soja]
MATPPSSPPPPTEAASQSSSTLKRTRKATRLRSLATRSPGADTLVVHVDPTTEKAHGPHKKKLRIYLGIVTRDKVDDTYENWRLTEFDIPEASDVRTKKKILQTFMSNLTSKWALATDKDSVDDVVCEKYNICKETWAQFCQSHKDPSWEDVQKKAHAIQKQNIAPTCCLNISQWLRRQRKNWRKLLNREALRPKRERRCHFKEKMSLEEAHHHRRPWIRAWRKKEMNEGRGREEHKILKRERRCHFKEKMSLEEAHHHRRPWIRAWRKKEMNEGRGREEHKILCSKRALKSELWFSPLIQDQFQDSPLSVLRRHVKWEMACTKKIGQMTSEAPKEITEKIDLLEEQASQRSFVSYGRQDVLIVAIGRPEHPGRVRAVRAGVTIKQYFESNPQTSHTSSSMAPEELEQLTQQIRDQLEESIKEKGLALPLEPKVGPSTAHVSIKESCVNPSGNDPDTSDSDKCGLYIEENIPHLVALGRVYEGSITIHNIPLLHDQVKVSVEEVKDADAPVPVPTDEVNLMGHSLNTFLAWLRHLAKRLSEQGVVGPAKPIDRLHHEPLQVMWDATVFGVFNEDFPLYIKHEDLFEIAHSRGFMGNLDVYGFLEPQSILKSGQSQFESESYMKNWMQTSKQDVYLGTYLNGPDNYLKGIINSALKGLDDTPQPKSKAGARWIVVKNIGRRKIEGASHPVGIVLSQINPKIYFSVWKLSQPTLRREGDTRLTGCVFQERNTRGVATNVYLRKTSEKPKKTWSMNFK